MKKNVNYKIFPELKLIIECCKGFVTLEDSIDMKIEEINDKLYNSSYNVIVDLQEVETPKNSNPMEHVNFFANYVKTLDLNHKVAFLTTKPHQVIIAELLMQLTQKELNLQIETFSTLSAAINFLGIANTKLSSISKKLNELNKNIVVD